MSGLKWTASESRGILANKHPNGEESRGCAAPPATPGDFARPVAPSRLPGKVSLPPPGIRAQSQQHVSLDPPYHRDPTPIEFSGQ